ncbi:MAG TPA: hypothetical protein VF751_06755, partial [Chthoniobacterales bacterium]
AGQTADIVPHCPSALDLGSEIDGKAKSDRAQVDTRRHAGSKSDAHRDGHGQTFTNSFAQTDSNTETDSFAEADLNSETDRDAKTHADSDSKTNADRNLFARCGNFAGRGRFRDFAHQDTRIAMGSFTHQP